MGQIFTYKLTLKNNKPYTKPTPIPLKNVGNANATSVIWDGGLGMSVAIIRVPSCLQIDFNFLENLKRNKLVDFYEVRNYNSEVVFYWRQMSPGQERTLTLDLIQRYSGNCLQKPHTAYLYYNNDQPVWVLPAK